MTVKQTGRPRLLVAGGTADPNLATLLQRAMERGLRAYTVLAGDGDEPRVTWEMDEDRLVIDGEVVAPTAAFLRHDVFGPRVRGGGAASKRALAWSSTITGWLRVHPEVRIANRGLGRENSKPHVLRVARGVGLEVPFTRVTNDRRALERLAREGAWIAKPVAGGDFCRELGVVLGEAEAPLPPLLVQPRLEQPEVRVYGVGARRIAFGMRSDALDYRTRTDTRVEPLALEEVPPGIVDGLGRLMAELRMDYAAADFKTDPRTGRLLFLEINSSPMFAAFDRVSGGAVGGAIVDLLTGE
jgi:hypothetical protein